MEAWKGRPISQYFKVHRKWHTYTEDIYLFNFKENNTLEQNIFMVAKVTNGKLWIDWRDG